MFSILVFTYNRHEMLKELLISILNQTYQNFEVIVVDRGSEPSAESVVKAFEDSRIRYIRSSQDCHMIDSANDVVKIIQGDYFIIPGDDDIFLPRAFELAKLAFENNQDSDIVQIGLGIYDASQKIQIINKEGISRFSNYFFYDEDCLQVKFDGKEMAKHAWSTSYVGDKVEYKVATPGLHPASTFVRKIAIDKHFDEKTPPFIKPFYDAFIYLIAYYSNVVYINSPLGLISEAHADKESIAPRRRWKSEVAYSKYFPLKMSHPAICAIDMALKSIYTFGLDKEYKTYVRFEIYYLLMECVINDPVKDIQTVKDLFEITPYVITEFCKQPAYATKYIFNHIAKGAFISGLKELLTSPKSFDKLVIRPLIKPIKNMLKNSSSKNNLVKENADFRYFDNILDYGTFIDEQFVQKNNRIALQRDL